MCDPEGCATVLEVVGGRGGGFPPPLVDPNIGGSAGRAVSRWAPQGGLVGTPTYIPQNDPHDALIILNIHNWDKKIFSKKFAHHTQVQGGTIPFHHSPRIWGGGGGMGGNGGELLCPIHRGQKNNIPGAAGAQVGCSSLVTVAVGLGVLREGGGGGLARHLGPRPPPPRPVHRRLVWVG